MRSSLPTHAWQHPTAGEQAFRRVSRSIAFVAIGFVLITVGASCGSSAKSTKPTKASASTAKGDSQKPSPVTVTTQATDTSQVIASRTMYVNVDAANARGGPAKDQPVVAKLKFLDPVTATGAVKDNWVEIQLTSEDGSAVKAWIHSSLISASADQAKAAHGIP